MSNSLRLALLVVLSAGPCFAWPGETDPRDETLNRGWTQFLGPDRNGVSKERGLLDRWPDGGPKELWRVPLGTGMSGIAADSQRADSQRAVTLARRNGQQAVVAFDATSGKVVAEVPIAPLYRNAMGDGARATPILDGDDAYAFTGEGVLARVDLSKEDVVWSHDVPTELGGEPAEYGMSSSPLLVDGLVVVIAGAPGATVVAYDTKTGKLAWKGGDDPAGYASPVLLEVGGKRQIVAFTGNSVLGLDPKSGERLWRYPYVTDYKCNTASPIAVDGHVLVSSGENHGSVLLDVSGSTPKVVWESQGPKSVLRAEWQTPILLGGHLFAFDNVGSAGAITHLTCLDAKTGEPVWQQPRFGKGNAIAAGGLLWGTTFKGELFAVRASTKGFEELGRVRVLAKTRQAPSLAAGRLFARDDRELVCFDIKAAK